MTSRMHRLARALSVAGSVSLSTLALAGTPELSPPAQVTTTATQGQLRQEAMKVEMALLGDPSTVNNPVTVAIENNCIKVKGTVADEATRQRILQVARQSCYLPVQAELGCSQLTGQMDSKQLKTQARSALIRQLGAGAGRLNVQVTAGGDIKLEGEVATIEEKLHASRAIREVSGTARIVNCIKVSGAANGGQSITLVSCNGPDVTCSKPSPVVQASGVTPRSDNIAKVSPSEEISPPLPKFQTTLPSGLPQPRIVKVSSETGDKKGRPVMYIPPPSEYTQGAGKTPAAKVVPTSGTQPVNGTDKVVVQNEVSGKTRRSFWEKLTVFKKDRQAHCDTCQTAEQTLRGGEATPVQEQVVSAPNARPIQQPQVRVEPQTMEPVLASQVSQPVVSYPAATPAVALPAQNPPVVQTTTPVGVSAGQANQPVWPPAYRTEATPVTASGSNYQSRPLAGLASRQPRHPSLVSPETPASPTGGLSTVPPQSREPIPLPSLSSTSETTPSAPAPIALPVQPASLNNSTISNASEVYRSPERIETVSLPATDEKSVEPKLTTGDKPTIRMTEKDFLARVQKVCGKLAKDIKVETTPDKMVIVHIHAKTAAEHQLVPRLLAVPELAARNVQLHLHVAN